MYKLLKDAKTGELSGVLKDGVMGIPFDPANSDYIAYLKWIEEGNVPTPAEENQ
jgi:hypothetical protein